MKKAFSTWIDESAKELSVMAISAGQVGVQVEVNPQALSTMIGAPFADVTTEEEE